MSRRKTIVKSVLIFAGIIILLVLSFVPFRVPGTFEDFQSFAGSIKLGIDLKGGASAVYDVADDEEDLGNLDARLDGTASRLLSMINGAGYMEATVNREGSTRIRIEVPAITDPTQLFDLIGKPADLQFKIEGETLVWGSNVTDAYAITYQGGYAIQLKLDAKGTEDFSNATTNNIGKAMDIVIDGETISSPNIEVAITNGTPVITGDFTYQAADDLAKKILSGALGVKLSIVEKYIISPTLGVDALSTSLIAGGIGILLVMIYLFIFYKGLGIVADICLMLFTGLLMWLLAAFPFVQLTLPGIAGIILSIGMAVDANVIIFERIKDEYKLGKSPRAASASGFKKALWTVLDANITTAFAAIILIILGKGSVRGFGITLLFGIILSVTVALTVSRLLTKYAVILFGDKPRMLGLKRDTGVLEMPDEDPAVNSSIKEAPVNA